MKKNFILSTAILATLTGFGCAVGSDGSTDKQTPDSSLVVTTPDDTVGDGVVESDVVEPVIRATFDPNTPSPPLFKADKYEEDILDKQIASIEEQIKKIEEKANLTKEDKKARYKLKKQLIVLENSIQAQENSIQERENAKQERQKAIIEENNKQIKAQLNSIKGSL